MTNTSQTRPRKRIITQSAALVATVHGAPPAVLATITGITREGLPLVCVAGGDPVVAQMVASISPESLRTAASGQAQAVVIFAGADSAQPIVLGLLATTAVANQPVVAKVDGKRVELTGEDEVVLTCGKASITLTKAGKVLIKGAYVLTEAQGANRLRGGSVQIN